MKNNKRCSSLRKREDMNDFSATNTHMTKYRVVQRGWKLMLFKCKSLRMLSTYFLPIFNILVETQKLCLFLGLMAKTHWNCFWYRRVLVFMQLLIQIDFIQFFVIYWCLQIKQSCSVSWRDKDSLPINNWISAFQKRSEVELTQPLLNIHSKLTLSLYIPLCLCYNTWLNS